MKKRTRSLIAWTVVMSTAAAVPSFAADARWAALLGYSPGMSREAARSAGLADCKTDIGEDIIECRPPQALRLGGASTIDSRIELSSKSGRVLFIKLVFARDSYGEVTAALVQKLGQPTFHRDDYQAAEWRRAVHIGDCSDQMIWHRGGDETVAVCGQRGSRSGHTHVLASRVPGLGKEWAAIAAARTKARTTADAFNSR